jgi:hypothetical protein
MQIDKDDICIFEPDEISQSRNEDITPSDDATTECAHPHLRQFTFSDGLAISLCPNCSVPFTSKTESLTTIDKLRGWILQGTLPR